MIDSAMGEVASQLNQALRRAFGGGEDFVAVAPLRDTDGAVARPAVNKIAVFLCGVEHETLAQNAAPAAGGLRAARRHEAVHLNLLVLFAAHFDSSHYPEALKLLSATVAFFQGRPTFDHHDTPELDPRISKLTMEIENLGITDLSNLWGMLGGHYQPSVLYRMRMLSLDSGHLAALQPRVARPEVEARP